MKQGTLLNALIELMKEVETEMNCNNDYYKLRRCRLIAEVIHQLTCQRVDRLVYNFF